MLRDFYLKIRLLSKTDQKEVWMVKNTLDGEVCVAKLQTGSDIEGNRSIFTRNVLHQGKFLQSMQGHIGIPFLHWAGKEQELGLNILIVQKLGSTLQDLYLERGIFSLKTVCQLGMLMIKNIQIFHQKGFVHGNLKLNSFQFGSSTKSQQLYFNDLTYCRSWAKRTKSKRKQLSKNKLSFSQFMPLDRMKGYECAKKDDLESIILILIFLLRGKLPWTATVKKLINTDIQESTEPETNTQKDSWIKQRPTEDSLKVGTLETKKERKQQIFHNLLAMIDEMPIEDICKGVPSELKTLMSKCRQMDYEDVPDYGFFMRTFKRIMAKNHWEADGIYDWTFEKAAQLSLTKKADKQSLNFELKGQQQILDCCYFGFSQKIELQ